MAMLKARRIHVDDRRRVFVVESVDIRCDKSGVLFGLLVRSEPVAVVVRDMNGAHAIDITGNHFDVDRLLDDVSELSVLLEP